MASGFKSQRFDAANANFLASGEEPPQGPSMEARVAKLEDALQGINISLARIDERLCHVATKADVEQVRTQLASLSAKSDGKADKADVSLLDGQVRSLPSMGKLSGLAGLTVIAVGIVEWGLKHL